MSQFLHPCRFFCWQFIVYLTSQDFRSRALGRLPRLIYVYTFFFSMYMWFMLSKFPVICWSYPLILLCSFWFLLTNDPNFFTAAWLENIDCLFVVWRASNCLIFVFHEMIVFGLQQFLRPRFSLRQGGVMFVLKSAWVCGFGSDYFSFNVPTSTDGYPVLLKIVNGFVFWILLLCIYLWQHSLAVLGCAFECN